MLMLRDDTLSFVEHISPPQLDISLYGTTVICVCWNVRVYLKIIGYQRVEG